MHERSSCYSSSTRSSTFLFSNPYKAVIEKVILTAQLMSRAYNPFKAELKFKPL